jgi:hypothetical protein
MIEQTVTPPQHVLLLYLGSGKNDEVLHRAAELCEHSGAQLSVALPVVDAAIPRGCCGIQGEQWRSMMDEETRESALRAMRLLQGLGCTPASVDIEVGSSIPDIAQQAGTRCSCDVIAVSAKRRPWSMGGLSRRQIKRIRRAGPIQVLELTELTTA